MRDRAVGVMTGLQAGPPLNPGSILSRVKKLFSQNFRTGFGAHAAFYPVCNWLLRGCKRQEREVDKLL